MSALKEGYKDTEIGVIPIEWEVKTLEDISKITMGQSPKSDTYNTDNIGMPLIQGNADCKNRKTIPRTYTTELTKECFIGDIIMTVRAPVGAISKSLHNACIGRGVCSIKSKKDNEYIYHCLVEYEDKWDKLSQGSTFTAVSGSDIKNLRIPLPPLTEQEKIADILSTADDKIDAITSQIQKAQTLKKGLLQKLLSEGINHCEFKDSEIGKIPESWEVVELDDLSKITMGQSPKSDTYNTDNIGIPLIQGNADCKNRKTIPRTYTTNLTKECFVGDIIMTVRAPVGAISKSLHNACIGRGVCSIKSKEDNEYIYHCLVAYEDKWDKLSQGSTFTAVSGSDIKNLKFPLPPLEEQKQIADILSTADEKLEVLRAKKQMYETLKKGLLQKLLSGKIRVGGVC